MTSKATTLTNVVGCHVACETSSCPPITETETNVRQRNAHCTYASVEPPPKTRYQLAIFAHSDPNSSTRLTMRRRLSCHICTYCTRTLFTRPNRHMALVEKQTGRGKLFPVCSPVQSVCNQLC